MRATTRDYKAPGHLFSIYFLSEELQSHCNYGSLGGKPFRTCARAWERA